MIPEEYGFKVKRGTEETWQLYLEWYKESYGTDYIPSPGKLLAVGFIDKDTNQLYYKLKVGNGVDKFEDLKYTDVLDSTEISQIVSQLENKFQLKLTAGQNITIDENNVISSSSSGLPEVTSADNGKILQVVDGKWEIVDKYTLIGEILGL